jgi:hypothetical protein
VALKPLEGAAQRRCLHVAGFGVEFGEYPSLVVVVT